MNRGLLDTNVLSELRRPRPEQRVVAFVAARPLETLHVSRVTFADIRFGIARLTDGARRAELADCLTHQLRPLFGQRVLPVGEDVMLRWRLLIDEGRPSGRTFSQPDPLIAATARVSGLTLLTRNTADFIPARVPVFNPWRDPAAP